MIGLNEPKARVTLLLDAQHDLLLCPRSTAQASNVRGSARHQTMLGQGARQDHARGN
jgi:hypothetical protein